MTFLKNLLYGLIIGLANIIPGVSGGTMAVVLNVFDDLIDSISNFKKNVMKNTKFLAGIIIGAGIAILLFSNAITALLDNHYMATNFFFIGVIVGSIPMVIGRAVEDRFKPLHLIPCLVTLGIMLFTVYFVPEAKEMVTDSLSFFEFGKMFFISFLAAVCMIIPGISGSFVMLLFGMYETITGTISELTSAFAGLLGLGESHSAAFTGKNFLIIATVAVGSILGILVASKIINKLLARYPQATYFAILGFMLGSIPAIVDKIQIRGAFVGGTPLVIGIIVFIGGAVISALFSNEKLKEKLTRKLKKIEE